MPINFIYSDSLETDTTESYFSNHFLNARIDNNQPSNAEYDPILEDQRGLEWKEAHWKEIKNNDLNYEKILIKIHNLIFVGTGQSKIHYK